MRKTSLFITILGAFLSSACLALYIISAIQSYYNDGFGISISYGDKDILLWFFLGIIVLIVGITHLLEDKKSLRYVYVNSSSVMLIGFIGACYYLATGIERTVSGKSFVENYILCGIFIIVLLLGLGMFLDKRQNLK